jgi:hypothetical protein
MFEGNAASPKRLFGARYGSELCLGLAQVTNTIAALAPD